MVNFHNPAVLTRDFLAFVKLLYTVDGLYIWEFVTNLDYEWSVIRGRRPYLWTIWIYSLARVTLLLGVIMNMINFSATSTHPIHCQTQITCQLVFAYTAVASATLLIVLRTIAIWNRNKFVVVGTILLWLASVVFYVRRIVQLQAYWLPTLRTCALRNPESRQIIVATLITDVSLLLTALFGLSRLRGRDSFLRLLWRQGAVWLALAGFVEVPPTVFVYLNLNGPFNTMFQIPAMIMMIIIATRMYRSLSNFHSSDAPQDGFQTDTVPAIKMVSFSTGATSLSRSEMDVQMHSQQSSGSQFQTSRYGVHQDRQASV